MKPEKRSISDSKKKLMPEEKKENQVVLFLLLFHRLRQKLTVQVRASKTRKKVMLLAQHQEQIPKAKVSSKPKSEAIGKKLRSNGLKIAKNFWKSS